MYRLVCLLRGCSGKKNEARKRINVLEYLPLFAIQYLADAHFMLEGLKHSFVHLGIDM